MNESIFNLSRVHKINLVITISIVCLIVAPLITLHGFKGALLFTIVGLAVIVIATVNYLLPTPDSVKGALFALLPAIIVTVLFFIDGFALNKHYLLIITIFMIAMYFDQKLIAIYTLFLNMCFVILFFGSARQFLGEQNYSLPIFITILAIINGALCMLYFLCKWGNQLLEDSRKKELQSEKLLEELSMMFETIKKSAHQLNRHSEHVGLNTTQIYESSRTILESANEIAYGAEEEEQKLKNMANIMQETAQVVKNSDTLSSEVLQVTTHMNEDIETSWSKVTIVSSQMNIVNHAIQVTTMTIDDLKESLSEVNAYLSGITDIANQTNLLALNASIEAARAGEHGKGFAVVAEEIRKLANITDSTLVKIDENLSQVNTYNREALLKLEDGLHKVTGQVEKTERSNNTFNALFDSMKNLQKELHQFTKSAEEIEQNSNDIQTSTNEFAAIIEESSNAVDMLNTSLQKMSKKQNDITKNIEETYQSALSLRR